MIALLQRSLGVSIVTGLIVAAVVACGSSPRTRFFTLDQVPPREHVQSRATVPFKVTAVHIPAVLDRDSMVRGEHHHELQISPQERWGGDFGEMARRVLTQDLQARLPMGTAIPADSPAPPNARGLVVDILNFEPDESGEVTLDAEWALVEGSPAHSIQTRSVHLHAAGADSAASQAGTMSQLLAQLADDIAAQISTAPHVAAAPAAHDSQ